jgi:transposase
VSQLACEAGVSITTVKRGLKELEAGEGYRPGERIRRSGGGMKKRLETDATLRADREQELHAKGDPMSFVQWTSTSLAPLVEALAAKGHQIKQSALADILHDLGCSLQATKKTIEGPSHPDRDAQCEHIHRTCRQFEQQGDPIISVDCKKKALLGTFTKNGREWQAKGEDTCVNVSDFLSRADGKAVPSGISDLIHTSGFVNVGIDHETAEFAVESIRRWWHQSGKALYPGKCALLDHSLPAASGSLGNADRNR